MLTETSGPLTLDDEAWSELSRVDLVDAETGAPPGQPTRVRVAMDDGGLRVRFDCRDEEPRATLRRRDEPLWTEDVVEVFLASGGETPRRYAEVQVNPLGTLFDAIVRNPDGTRERMEVDAGWDWPGIEWRAERTPEGWAAVLRLPWVAGLVERGTHFRGNFYRIDRPPNSPPEHSAWSPTLRTRPDFHVPERFGHLLVET